MLSKKEKAALKDKPRLLLRHARLGTNTEEALRCVVELPHNQGPLLNKYYQSLDANSRLTAAGIIAASVHRDAIRTPDAAYLYAWLEQAFVLCRAKMNMGHTPENEHLFGGRNTTILSVWLRESPTLLASTASLVGRAFKNTGAYSLAPHKMEWLLDYTVPRQFRSVRFYKELLTQVPTLLMVAARHIPEKECVLAMCPQQCQYAAGLSQQWRSVYPQSTIATDINSILSTMQTLGEYTPALLHTGLGMLSAEPLDVLTLPSGMDFA